MGIEDTVKEDAAKVEAGYNVAEAKVDGFFASNKYTVLILTGVAVVLVGLVIVNLL